MLIGTASAGKYCCNRATEWILAACMLNWGLTTVATPETISKGAFKYLSVPGPQGLGIPWQLFAAVMLTCAFAWFVALLFNGNGLPWTARTRAICSIVCAVTLAYMALCLWRLSPDTLTYSLGIGSHAIWGAGALYSCLRAGLDALGETDDAKPVVTVAVYDNSDDGTGVPADTVRRFGQLPDIEITSRTVDGVNTGGRGATVPKSVVL